MFEVAEIIGLIAFAISGFFVAVRNNLDLLGILISTFLTAFGGGIARDVIVGKTPYPFGSDIPALIVISVMILMILLRFHKKPSIENKSLFILSDSIGLVSFSIAGSLIAISQGYNLTGVLVLSFITAVGGGIARDIILNEVPFVFKTGFYGTVSLVVGLGVYTLHRFDMVGYTTLFGIFVASVALRLIAFYRKWSVPLV